MEFNAEGIKENNKDLERVFKSYCDTIFRISLLLLFNEADAEDVLQSVMIQYYQKAPSFKDEDHEKAWIIKVTNNMCKNMLRSKKRYIWEDITDIHDYIESAEEGEILKMVINLPYKYKTVLYLYYFEGYKTAEIAHILRISTVAVRKRLEYGRNQLRLEYRKELSHETW